jgi:Lysozyme like domain
LHWFGLHWTANWKLLGIPKGIPLIFDIAIVIFIALGGYFLVQTASGESLGFGSTGSSILGTLTAAQIAQYASDAGFSGDDLVTAVAIALAESAGNPNAQGDMGNPIAGQFNAFGLWQINIGKNPQFANDNLTDPTVNASDAYTIYSEWGSGFGAWSTYNNGVGTYQNFLATAQDGVNQLG